MKRNNKKAQSLGINKIISFIIVLIVLVLVIMGIIFLYQKDFFSNLPIFSNENVTNENYDSNLCPFNTAEIASDRSILIEGTESYLYLDKENKIHVNNNYNIISNDDVIGEVRGEKVELREGLVEGDPEFYKKYSDYKDYLPTIEQLKMFDGSYRLGNSRFFCKSQNEREAYNFDLNCKETCSVYNGLCKSSAPSSSISLGKLDCNDGNFCYVTISEEKTYENEFRIENFKFDALSSHGERVVLENNFEIAEFSSGESRFFSYEVTNKIPFCYIIRTDKKIIDKGYFFKSLNDDYKGSVLFQYTNDKFFEFIAWNPESGEKIYKKVKLNLKGEDTHFAEGKFVDNDDFKKEALLLKNGEFFYVTLNNPITFDNRIPSSYSISHYKINRIDDKFIISGFYLAKSDNKFTIGEGQNIGEWHNLDCNNGLGDTFTPFSNLIGISLYDLEDTLKDSIASQNCELLK